MTTRQTESRSGVPVPTSGQCSRIRSDECWQNTRRRGRHERRREVLYDVLDGDGVVGTTPHSPRFAATTHPLRSLRHQGCRHEATAITSMNL